MPNTRPTAAALSVCLAAILLAPPFAPSISADAPCAPELTKRKPATPIGLRILTSLGGSSAHFEAEFETGSGPRVRSEESTGASTPHAYFNALASRADCMVAYSLRDQQQLTYFSRSTARTQDVTYDPVNDPDPRRQDAAKIVIPADITSLPNQVRLPIASSEGRSLLVIWDSWLGREWDPDLTGIGDNKMFQLASPAGRIWTEVKSDFNWGKQLGALAVAKVRSYAELGVGLGPEVSAKNPIDSQAGVFAVKAETWTRYWVFFNPVGEWHEFSLWVADVNRDAVLVLDRVKLKPNYGAGATGWESFWLEYNTSGSGNPDGFGARVAYARNVVMLRGVTSVSGMLVRPVP